MPTLHIEHPITDFATWSAAFDRFAEIRRQAGVRGETVQQPCDDPRYVVVDLQFDTVDAAQSFLHFLTTQVWANPESSPALDGTPQARVLEVASRP